MCYGGQLTLEKLIDYEKQKIIDLMEPEHDDSGTYFDLIDATTAYRDTQWLDKIKKINEENPYPEDIFIEPTPAQWEMVRRLVEKEGYALDKFAGAISRRVWRNCCETLLKEE